MPDPKTLASAASIRLAVAKRRAGSGSVARSMARTKFLESWGRKSCKGVISPRAWADTRLPSVAAFTGKSFVTRWYISTPRL